jgi:hypothetical protein
LFTLNSRYTYSGGYGVSSKDISGSVEDLTGYTRKQRRNLSKFSKSSPDLFGASYQSSDDDDVTEKETDEDFVTRLDIETNLENESSTKRGENNEHGNGSESVTETKHENTKFRLETKWATNTENEARFQLSTSTLKIETIKQNTSSSNEAKNSTFAMFEELDIMTDEKEPTTHAQHPGANDAVVSSGSKNNDDEKSERFDKGWQTILHSGKADLRRSLESLSSFRQDMNSNVDTFGSERSADVVELQQGMSEETILKQGEDTKDYEAGMKRNDEMVGLNMDDLLRSEKPQKLSHESVHEIFSQSNTWDSNTTVDEQRNYSEVTTTEDSGWRTSYEKERCTTDDVNTNHATTTSLRQKTANGNEEKQAAVSVINFENNNADLCTSTEEDAAVNKLCPTSDMEIFHTNYNILTSEAPKIEWNYDSSRSTTTNSTVLRMEETTGPQPAIDDIPSSDKTVKSEGFSTTIIPQSCNISPISFRVLKTTSCDESEVWQKTEEYKGESTIATVKVSGIRQSSICVTENGKTTVDCDQYLLDSCINEPKNNRLNNSSYEGSCETPQTIEERPEPFNNDCDQSLYNSTHEPISDWLNNTTDTAKNADSPMESADNSLIKNMMGMFCLLGLKDSPERDFYSNGQVHDKEQTMAKDISCVGDEQGWCVDEAIIKSPTLNIPKDINKKLFTFNENQGSFEEQESFNDTEAERWTTWEQNNNERTAVDEETFDDPNIVEGNKIQQITLYESPQKQATVEEYISDVLTGNAIALEETSNSDRDLLLNTEPDKTLRVSDFENGKQKKAVQHRNTEETIDEGIILQTTQTQELLLQTPDNSERKLATQNEAGDFQRKDERIVELNMREKHGIDFSLNTAELLITSNEKGLSLSQENTKEQNMKNTITTTNLEINRNKWSYACIIPLLNTAELLITSNEKGLSLSRENTKEQNMKNTITTTNLEINRNKWSYACIIPLRTMNVSKKFSRAFNVLVLDSELKPTSPERKPTVVTLNLFPHETEETYSREQNVEVSQVEIQINDEKEIFIPMADESTSDLLQEADKESIGSNIVEEQVIQSNPADNNLEQNPVELEIMMDQDNSENSPGQVDYTKQLHEDLLTADHELETTVCLENGETELDKIDEIQRPIFQTEEATTNITFMGNVHEKSLSDSREKETNEIINDAITPTEMQPDYFAKSESDHQIHETVHKVDVKTMTDKRLSEHLMSFETDELVAEKIPKQEKTEKLFSELDGIFLQENEIQETISKEERIQYETFSEVDEFFTSEGMEEQETEACVKYPQGNNEVSLSEFATQKDVIQHLNEQNSSQSEKEVPEVITKTVDERSLQYKHFSRLDEVLKPEYVHEIVPNKVETQHDKQNYLSETDKYFDSIIQQPITEKINNIQLEQSSELPELRTEPGTKNIDKSMASPSDLISFQNNEVEIVQTEKDKNDGGLSVKEQNLQDDVWEITFNDQNVFPMKEVVSTASKDNGLNDKNRDELILVISHPNYPMNSEHLYEEDRSDDEIRQCTASPIPDDLSSVTSNYDASIESSSESTQSYTQHQRNGEDYLMRNGEDYLMNHDVPWDVTVSYSNHETTTSEYKILRASYSDIQQEVYKVESHTSKNINGGINNPLHVPKQSDISEHLHTSHSRAIPTTENNFNINIDVTPNAGTEDKGNEYRTTMDIQNHNQVSTSYLLFQRFGKPESPKTYFELNYDMDTWKVGKKISSHEEDDSEKSFVVSYATIEQLNHPQVASPVYLPSIEDDEIYDQEICDIQAIQLVNDEEVRIGFLQSSPPPSLPQQTPPQSPLPPPPSSPLQTPPSSSPPPPSSPPPTDDAGHVGINHHLPPPPEDLPYRPSGTIQAQRLSTPPTEDAGHVEINHHLPTLPEDLPYQPSGIIQAQRLPTPPTEDAGHVGINHHLPTPPEDLPYQPSGIIQAQRLPTPPTEDAGHVGINHHLPTPPEDLPYQPSGIIQAQRLSTPPTEDTGHVEINHHLPTPPEDLPYESSSTIHIGVPPSVSESRPPVWSFAQSVFHTDGQSKTFFKVIDNRKKWFQSSTFLYRGERVKVSRGVNIFKNSAKKCSQDIGDEQTMDSRVDEDYEGYSEIWDDGNLMAGNVIGLYFIS